MTSKKIAPPNKLSYEYVQKYIENLGYILLSQDYLGNFQKIILKDKEGYYYTIQFRTLQNGAVPIKFHKSNPYTIQNIRLWCKINNKPFKLISDKYEGNNKKLKWKCLKPECGEEFEMSWASIQSGHGCGVCVGRQIKESNCLAVIEPRLALEWHPTKNGKLTPYNVSISSGKRIWWRCNKGHEWRTSICNRKNGRNCPYCSGKLPSDDYNLLVINPVLCEEWDYNKNKKMPNEYTPMSNQKVWWKCKKCGHEWETTIASRNSGIGCIICNESKGEVSIQNYLNTNKIINIPQKTFDKLIGIGGGNLSYDFYLPNYNLLIEYQGEFHNGGGNYYTKRKLKYQQEHDRRKREYAKEHNIKLLEIWYWDYDNVENILNKELQFK